MTPTDECRRCNAHSPDLGSLDASDWERVRRALTSGSVWLAAGEVKLAKACTDVEARQWIDHLLECPGSWVFPAVCAEALDELDSAFARLQKPEHFTDYSHCEECQEHDSVLRSRNVATVRRADFGRPGWSPIGFCTPDALLYYFPALARYALLPDILQYEDLPEMFLYAIGPKGHGAALMARCTAAQRASVQLYLRCISPESVAGPELSEALALWGALT
jgi:hypothetical protein